MPSHVTLSRDGRRSRFASCSVQNPKICSSIAWSIHRWLKFKSDRMNPSCFNICAHVCRIQYLPMGQPTCDIGLILHFSLPGGDRFASTNILILVKSDRYPGNLRDISQYRALLPGPISWCAGDEIVDPRCRTH